MASITKREEGISPWPFVRWIKPRNRWLVDARTKNGGKCRFFKSKAEAVTWRKMQLVRRQNEGDGAFDDRKLARFGWSVADAIKFSLDHLRKRTASIPLADVVTRLLAAKKEANRAGNYISDFDRRLKN